MRRECGGCPWLDESTAAQHAAKLDSLRLALAERGLDFPEPTLISAGSSLGYRNRLRLRVDELGSAVFFNPRKLTSCAVLDPVLADAVARLRESGPLPGLLGTRHLELRVADDARIGLCVYADQVVAQSSRAALGAALPAEWQIGYAGDPRLPRLDYYLEEPVGEPRGTTPLDYQVPLSSFVQVNSAVSRALVARVRGLVRAAGLRSFNDLFCGSGNFSLPLLADGLDGESVELDAQAIAALDESAARWRRQGRNHRARVGDARGASLEPRELLVANPPRAGLKLEAGDAQRLAGSATRCVALCSCSPQSLARDLAEFTASGFELREVTAFDMFPHTEHLETLAWLERPRAGGSRESR